MNPNLPDLYFLEGVAGVVFKDPLSASRWAEEHGYSNLVDRVLVVYYGSNLRTDMKTTEDLQKEKA